MKKTVLFAVLFCLLAIAVCYSPLSAQSMENDETGRYVLAMMNGRAVTNNRVPAIVLDSVRGIIWTCQNLQDGKPLWVKTDLGQNGNKPMTKRKYIVKMLEWQDADLRMPAIVVDTEEGIVWTCPNIIDGRAVWVQKNLTSDFQE